MAIGFVQSAFLLTVAKGALVNLLTGGTVSKSSSLDPLYEVATVNDLDFSTYPYISAATTTDYIEIDMGTEKTVGSFCALPRFSSTVASPINVYIGNTPGSGDYAN